MKILIVVDMQNDFVTGSLGSPEAQAIVPNIIEKIKQYAADPESAIVFTRDTHYNNYMETMEGQYLPVPHCIAHTEGWSIIDELVGATVNFDTKCKCVEVYNKYTFGLYELPKLIADLGAEYNYEQWEVESVELVGVCTDICVISNALLLKADYVGIPITVDSSCCAGVTPAKHEAALEVMRSCQINVI